MSDPRRSESPATTGTGPAARGVAVKPVYLPSLTASQRERYAYYGRAARTSLELSDKVHD